MAYYQGGLFYIQKLKKGDGEDDEPSSIDHYLFEIENNIFQKNSAFVGTLLRLSGLVNLD